MAMDFSGEKLGYTALFLSRIKGENVQRWLIISRTTHFYLHRYLSLTH